jgi:WD40 repeat protein
MFHWGPISSVSSNKHYIATAGYDNQLILWDPLSHKSLARSVHDHLINHCAFSHNGHYIVTASSDYSARVWHVPSLQLKTCLTGHHDDVDMASFSPDDQLIATCALDRLIRIFDMNGACLQTLSGHTGNIISVEWSHDGSKLISSSVDGTVREWCVKTGAELICHNMDNVRTDTLEIAGDGTIYAGDDEGRIAIIRDATLNYINAHKAGIKKIALDEQGQFLISLSYDRHIAVWEIDGDSLIEKRRCEYPHNVWARAAAIIDDHKIALGTFGSTYITYDWIENRWNDHNVTADKSLNAITVHDGDFYSVGDAGIIFKNNMKIADVKSLCNFIICVEDRLYCGGQLGIIYDAYSQTEIYQHHSPLNCAISYRRNDDLYVVFGSYTGDLIIFKKWQNILIFQHTLKIFDNAVKGLCINDHILFAVCANTRITWLESATFSVLRTLDRAHQKIINGCCALSPNSFATISRDLDLSIWTGEDKQTYPTPHPNSIKCISVSTDKKRIMTGAYTGTLAGFDVEKREWYKVERPTSSGISSLAYDDVLDIFYAASYDGQVYRIK